MVYNESKLSSNRKIEKEKIDLKKFNSTRINDFKVVQ